MEYWRGGTGGRAFGVWRSGPTGDWVTHGRCLGGIRGVSGTIIPFAFSLSHEPSKREKGPQTTNTLPPAQHLPAPAWLSRVGRAIVAGMKTEVPIRVTLVCPPAGVAFAVQKGKGEIVSVTRSDGGDVSFDVTLDLAGKLGDGSPRFTGAFAQGPADGRFVYVTIGDRAGDPNSPWSRRAKIPLTGISWEMVEAVLASPGSVLSARFPGTAKDGCPACASLKPVDGWHVLRAD